MGSQDGGQNRRAVAVFVAEHTKAYVRISGVRRRLCSWEVQWGSRVATLEWLLMPLGSAFMGGGLCQTDINYPIWSSQRVVFSFYKNQKSEKLIICLRATRAHGSKSSSYWLCTCPPCVVLFRDSMDVRIQSMHSLNVSQGQLLILPVLGRGLLACSSLPPLVPVPVLRRAKVSVNTAELWYH